MHALAPTQGIEYAGRRVPDRSPASSPRPFSGLPAILLAAAILWTTLFACAGAIGLIGPDEPRYVSIARSMAESGDWVTPRLNGEPWFEKPILYYWTAAAAFRVLGASDGAARVPSALAALAATLALAAVCARAYGPGAAFALVLIMPTCGLLMGFAHGASTDMVFSGTLGVALALAATIVGDQARTENQPAAMPGGLTGGRHPGWLLGWGAALGVAVLAKGPAAILLAGGSVGLWALLTRRWADAFRLAHPLAIGAALVVALPWYVLCAQRNPDFFQVFIIEHNVQRFLTPVFEHQQPFWYFGVVLLLGLVPWTALLVPVLRDARAWASGRHGQHVALLAACWALVTLVFFSLSKSKLPGYILPAFPPAAFLMARVAARDADAQAPSLCHALMVIGTTFALLTAAVLGVAAGGGAFLSQDARLVLADLHVPAAAGLLVAGSGVAIAVLARRRQAWAALTMTSALTAALLLTVGTLSLPAMDARLTARPAAAVAVQAAGDGPIALYRLERAWKYGLEYYTRRVVPAWDGHSASVVVTSPDGAAALRALGHRIDTIATVSTEAVVLRAAGR